MRKFSYAVGLFSVVFLLAFGFYASYRFFSGDSPRSMETESSMEPEFEIREDEGMVTVYTEDGELYETTEILYASLPEKVRDRIREGYVIRGKQRLYGFLENYSS
ncbi:MAG: hypothetical protein KH275_01760 [Clostridiales bacterium]|nr:hypothetical protein [Clostridiales bacterium]